MSDLSVWIEEYNHLVDRGNFDDLPYWGAMANMARRRVLREQLVELTGEYVTPGTKFEEGTSDETNIH